MMVCHRLNRTRACIIGGGETRLSRASALAYYCKFSAKRGGARGNCLKLVAYKNASPYSRVTLDVQHQWAVRCHEMCPTSQPATSRALYRSVAPESAAALTETNRVTTIATIKDEMTQWLER